MENLQIRDPQSNAPLPLTPPETGAWCGHGEKAANDRIAKVRIDKNLSRPSDSVFFLAISTPNLHPSIVNKTAAPC